MHGINGHSTRAINISLFSSLNFDITCILIQLTDTAISELQLK